MAVPAPGARASKGCAPHLARRGSPRSETIRGPAQIAIVTWGGPERPPDAAAGCGEPCRLARGLWVVLQAPGCLPDRLVTAARPLAHPIHKPIRPVGSCMQAGPGAFEPLAHQQLPPAHVVHNAAGLGPPATAGSRAPRLPPPEDSTASPCVLSTESRGPWVRIGGQMVEPPWCRRRRACRSRLPRLGTVLDCGASPPAASRLHHGRCSPCMAPLCGRWWTWSAHRPAAGAAALAACPALPAMAQAACRGAATRSATPSTPAELWVRRDSCGD